jgi:2-oxoglutarate ferredoxin oxidoreductase subunit alpha
MQRLQRKFETAKELVPAPVIQQNARPAKFGVIWFGSTGAAMGESLAALETEGIRPDQLRIRAFPFADAVADFIQAHEHVFVVEQNRDAQMKSLLVN